MKPMPEEFLDSIFGERRGSGRVPSTAHARTAADCAEAGQGAGEVTGLLSIYHQEEYEVPIPELGGHA